MKRGSQPSPPEGCGGVLAGLDPGRSKCGLVLADPGQARVTTAAILPPDAAIALLEHWRDQTGLTQVVLGDGTGSRPWPERLQQRGLSAAVVDERGTTLAARQRYWELDPAPWHLRLVPRGLRLPRRDIDDVVAQLLLERWLGTPLGRRSDEVLRRWPAGRRV